MILNSGHIIPGVVASIVSGCSDCIHFLLWFRDYIRPTNLAVNAAKAMGKMSKYFNFG